MNRLQLKKLIQESVNEILAEMRSYDPTKKEMLDYLKSQFGKEEGFNDAAEIAMYWFANFYHSGQTSNLYSVLSTSPYTPGRMETEPVPGSFEEILFNALEDEFGQQTEKVREMTTTSAVQGYMAPRAFKKKRKIKENDSAESPLYVEYLKELPGEEPFLLQGQKFQYVLAKYPNGKKDIGVYAFAGDIVYGYDAFKQRYNLKEDSSSHLSQTVIEGYVLDWILEKLQTEKNPKIVEALKVVQTLI